jgi:hypothetical protein
MFFNAHAYYSIERSRGVAEPLRILGALLADSALTGTVNWTDLHDKYTIQALIAQLGKSEALLGLGLIDHYDLDLKSHDAYQGDMGYAFSRQTPQLRILVARACKLESPEQVQRLAHNFIEAGVDINLLRRDKTIQDKLRKALELADISGAAKHVSNLLKKDSAATTAKLKAFTALTMKYDLRKLDGWVALWVEIISLLLHKKADEPAVKEALRLATSLTAKDYQQVLTT